MFKYIFMETKLSYIFTWKYVNTLQLYKFKVIYLNQGMFRLHNPYIYIKSSYL